MDYYYYTPNPSSSSSAVGSSSSTAPNTTPVMITTGCKKGGNKKSKKGGKGVKLSTDPQSVAARERRHRISDRFKILQSLVPGGTKMDTVSMLDEAIHYVKFLKTQIWIHQNMMMTNSNTSLDHANLIPANICNGVPYNSSSWGEDGFYYSSNNACNVDANLTAGVSQKPLPQLGIQSEDQNMLLDACYYMKY